LRKNANTFNFHNHTTEWKGAIKGDSRRKAHRQTSRCENRRKAEEALSLTRGGSRGP